MSNSLFRTKSIDLLMADSTSGESGLKRTLGPWALVALGIGAIIGAGLFVRTAAAIADRAGPSVTIAFLVAGLGWSEVHASARKVRALWSLFARTGRLEPGLVEPSLLSYRKA